MIHPYFKVLGGYLLSAILFNLILGLSNDIGLAVLGMMSFPLGILATGFIPKNRQSVFGGMFYGIAIQASIMILFFAYFYFILIIEGNK